MNIPDKRQTLGSMKHRRIGLAGWLVGILMLAVTTGAAADRIIHREKSLYRNIVVKEGNGQRCLVFAVKLGDKNQTCMDIDQPEKVVFPYARMTFAGLLLTPAPKQMLVIGLGGGTIPTVLAGLYPEAHIDVVEIDPAVIAVAKAFFDFRETDNMTVHAGDARVFIKRAARKAPRYDLIILDAFTGDYIPEHLMTVEFLNETRALLTPPGTLVANTFSTSTLYDHESVTYAQVFGEFINFKLPITGNRVIIAANGALPDRQLMFDRSKQLTARLESHGIQLNSFMPHLTTARDWRDDARPLTDQFSPVNLLREP
jgi:spermidine synthase